MQSIFFHQSFHIKQLFENEGAATRSYHFINPLPVKGLARIIELQRKMKGERFDIAFGLHLMGTKIAGHPYKFCFISIKVKPVRLSFHPNLRRRLELQLNVNYGRHWSPLQNGIFVFMK